MRPGELPNRLDIGRLSSVLVCQILVSQVLPLRQGLAGQLVRL
jgi:hypothetical protein